MFRVKSLAARHVAGFHWVGPWEETIPLGFKQLSRWADAHHLRGEWLAVYYDDPDVVPAAQLRCDTVITVGDNFMLPAGCEGARLITLPAGLYAVGLARVENNAFFEAWEQLFDQIEADGRYSLTGNPCYERYLSQGDQPDIWELELMIPVAQR